MSVALVHNASAAYAGTGTPPLTITAPTVGNTLVLLVTSFANSASTNPTVSSATHGADNFVQAASARSTNTNGGTTLITMADIWYVLSAGNTGTNVTVNLSNATSSGTVRCYEYSGSGITFAAAAGTTNLASTATPIGLGASIANTNGFMVAVETAHTQATSSPFVLANGGVTYAAIDQTSGENGANLLNKAAGSYAPKFQLAAADNTVSISNAAFQEANAASSVRGVQFSFLPGFGGGR